MKGLTIEQMEFLVSKGLDAADMIALAKMGTAKSKGAERTARWRAKKQGIVTESVTSDVTRDASPPPIDNHTPPVSSDEETRARPKKSEVLAKPDDVSAPVWKAFTALRRKKGGLSEVALAGIRREAEKAGWTLEAALSRCVERNWQGFEAEWVKPTTGPPANGSTSFLDHMIDRQRRAEAQEHPA